MTASGRKRPFENNDFGLIECPLWGKADIRQQVERAQPQSAYNSTIAPPLPRKSKARPCAGFFVPAIHLFDVRFAPGSGHSANIA